MLEDGSQVEELMELTAQSLVDLEIQDRFDVIKEIGRGKYGRVLLVTHRCRGTPMALKVMPKASTQLQGFLREYCISLHLSGHPCIVGLFGIAFRSTEHYCFAQELVIGRDLFAVIQPKVGIPEASVKRCALQIGSALEFIHSRGLVHRDVKPENVLLLDARCCRVKLADFGLAQRRGAFIRFITGTLPYSAPELCERVLQEGQVQAPPLSVEPSLDTWAFGVLLFCILTGYFPWESCSDKDDFYQEWNEWNQAGEEGERGGEKREEREGDANEGGRKRDVEEEKTEGDKGWNKSGGKGGEKREEEKREEERGGDTKGEEVKEEGKEGNQELTEFGSDVGGKGEERKEGRREGDMKGEERQQGREEEEEVPPLWRRFTPDALQMFRRLLAVEPERRSSVSEVQAFVQRDWLKQAPPTHQAPPTGTPPEQTPPTDTHKATHPLAPPPETSSCSRSEKN